MDDSLSAAVHELVKTVESSIQNKDSELEFHFGKNIANTSERFRNGFYDIRNFSKILKRFENFGHWDAIDSECMAEQTVLTHKHEEFKVRYPWNQNGFQEGKVFQKSLLRKVQVVLTDSPLAFQLILKKETESSNRFTFGRATFFRLRNRKQFSFTEHGMTFEFAFSEVWQGKTLQAVKSVKPCYEIEFELKNLDSTSITHEQKVKQILHKVGFITDSLSGTLSKPSIGTNPLLITNDLIQPTKPKEPVENKKRKRQTSFKEPEPIKKTKVEPVMSQENAKVESKVMEKKQTNAEPQENESNSFLDGVFE